MCRFYICPKKWSFFFIYRWSHIVRPHSPTNSFHFNTIATESNRITVRKILLPHRAIANALLRRFTCISRRDDVENHNTNSKSQHTQPSGFYFSSAAVCVYTVRYKTCKTSLSRCRFLIFIFSLLASTSLLLHISKFIHVSVLRCAHGFNKSSSQWLFKCNGEKKKKHCTMWVCERECGSASVCDSSQNYSLLNVILSFLLDININKYRSWRCTVFVQQIYDINYKWH